VTDYAGAWFRTAFEEAAIGMAIMTMEGDYLRVNRSLCHILGRDADTLLGLNILDVTHPDDRPDSTERLKHLATGKAHVFEKRYIHADGHVVWVGLHVSPVPDARGQPGYLVSQIQDISARKQMEEALRHVQKMDAVGRLAGGIAHDFNNLLTAARLNTDLLRQSIAPDNPDVELLDEVSAALDRAAGLTRQLLVVSRRSFAHPAPLDVNDLIRRITPLLERLAGPAVTVRAALDPNGAWTHADTGQIEELLLTLTGRARDAIAAAGGSPPEGRVEITTREAALHEPHVDQFGRLAPGRYISLTIRDTGRTLTPGELERIFEPFYLSRHGGDEPRMGLGLAAVYGIVQQGGGHIRAESALPHGTRFTAFLPALQ